MALRSAVRTGRESAERLGHRVRQRAFRHPTPLTVNVDYPLRAAIGLESARFPDRPRTVHLDEAGVVPLKPDLCLLEGRRIVWVGDAKYKRLPVGGYRNADLYELLAYAVALDLPGGTLVYAADEGTGAAQHVVVHAGKRLRVVALDLVAPRSALLRQIQELAGQIAPTEPVRTSA